MSKFLKNTKVDNREKIREKKARMAEKKQLKKRKLTFWLIKKDTIAQKEKLKSCIKFYKKKVQKWWQEKRLWARLEYVYLNQKTGLL